MKLTGVTFRCTTGEKKALEELARRRAANMAERGEVPDDTVTGYLRTVIRRDAKASNIRIHDQPTAKGQG